MVKDIYIIGAGTLGQFAADIIDTIPEYNLVGFFDDSYPEKKSIMGTPIVGKFSDFSKLSKSNLCLGVGEPKIREQLFSKGVNSGNYFPKIIHPSAVISKFSSIADGVLIGPNSSVLSGCSIGYACCLLSHVNVNQNVNMERFSLIGAGAIIGNNAQLGEGCHLTLGCHIPLNGSVQAWEKRC